MTTLHHGGGLHLHPTAQPLSARPRLDVPDDWDCPVRLDNSGYCTPLESQGHWPWCAAYSMNQLLQASFWREFHRKVDFPEEYTYREAKTQDGIKGDGTTLNAVMNAVEGHDFGVGYLPRFEPKGLYSLEDVLFAIHTYGIVMVGLQITKGWDSAGLTKDGMIGPDPTKCGGHAVLNSSYDLDLGHIWGPNWWTLQWGQKGFWKMTLDQFRAQFAYGCAMRINWEKIQ
jgi:hypothetical protein